MGRYVFRLPDVGEGTTEAEIAQWHVKVGDLVAEEQPLVDVTTDKATVEISAPVAGKVLAVNGTPGEKLPVGSELVVLEVAGEGDAETPAPPASPPPAAAAPAPAAAAKAAAAKPSPPPTPVAAPAAAPSPPIARRPGDRPVASPAVRQRARDLGIELQFVPGSGPGGRIGHGDLDAYIAGGGRPAAAAMTRREGIVEVKVIGIRRTIAERMQEAKRRIPHYSYIEEVDVTQLEALRQSLNAALSKDAQRLTLLPFLIRALARAVPEHPEVNARFDDDAGVVARHAALHVGIATQTPNGLLVPVLRHAEALDLGQCASEVARLAQQARDGKIGRAELSGSTITVTSLGALGGLATTPVINHPEVAIVGVNRMVERPMVVDGQIAVRKMMNLSSSFDHRVVDGWDAARFVQRLRTLLEQPALLFVG